MFFVSTLLIIMEKQTMEKWEIFGWCRLCLSSVDWRKKNFSPLAFIYFWTSDLFLGLFVFFLFCQIISFSNICQAKQSAKMNASLQYSAVKCLPQPASVATILHPNQSPHYLFLKTECASGVTDATDDTRHKGHCWWTGISLRSFSLAKMYKTFR